MNLENNSREMKTVVETYIIEETASLIYDNEQLDKWNELVSELGLTGQTQIVVKEKSPVPFMHLKTNLVEVFSTLCPRKEDVSKYNKTPIPVEILDLVALSKREGYFDKIQIWYDDKTPDPVCIGLRYENEKDRSKGYEWYMHKYLLGKWGDVKHSFSELTSLAIKRWMKEENHRQNQNLIAAKRAIEDLELNAINKFGSEEENAALDILPF